MWYIKNKDSGDYFYDYTCGCYVWKGITRAAAFDSKFSAQCCVNDLEMQDFTGLEFIEEIE